MPAEPPGLLTKPVCFHRTLGYASAHRLRPPPQVLEFNVRLGDPEAQVLLPLLRADWYDICVKCANRWPMTGMEQWWDTRTHAVNVVVCHAGYPATGPVGADGCVVRVAGDDVENGAGEDAGELCINDEVVGATGGWVDGAGARVASRTLVFCRGVQSARAVQHGLVNAGLPAGGCHGSMPEEMRKSALAALLAEALHAPG